MVGEEAKPSERLASLLLKYTTTQEAAAAQQMQCFSTAESAQSIMYLKQRHKAYMTSVSQLSGVHIPCAEKTSASQDTCGNPEQKCARAVSAVFAHLECKYRKYKSIACVVSKGIGTFQPAFEEQLPHN